MKPLRTALLLSSIFATFSSLAFANKCVCVTLTKDTCGSCEDSACGGNVCAVRLPSRSVGWNQLVPGFTLQEVAGKIVVSNIVPSAPADRAGMQVGDEVVSLDGIRLPLCWIEAKAWQIKSMTHAVLVKRQGRTLALEVTPTRLGAMLETDSSARIQRAGLRNEEPLLPKWAPFLSGLVLSPKGHDFEVTAVLAASSAAQSGIAPGDIISADGFAPKDFSQLEGASYRSYLKIQVSGPRGRRTVHLSMKSLSEMMTDLSRKKIEIPAVSKGM